MGTAGEDLVDVCDHCLDVGRAVLRHKLADRFKVTPVVTECFSRVGHTGKVLKKF